MSEEITQQELIDIIESHPEDKTYWDKENWQFIKLYGKDNSLLKIYKSGTVHHDGDMIGRLDDTYTKALFDRFLQKALIEKRELLRERFERFKNGG